MKTLPMASNRPLQKLHPLTLLAQLTSRQANGCLQVSTGAASWLIYLEQGQLIYASNSIDPFERLDRHLRQMSSQVPVLVSAVRVQIRLLFEQSSDVRTEYRIRSQDYQAICWLVDQQYLDLAQAASLIQALAKEVIESFLLVREGSYELIEHEDFHNLPKFCHLKLRPLVESCQHQLRQRQVPKRNPTSLLPYPSPADSNVSRQASETKKSTAEAPNPAKNNNLAFNIEAQPPAEQAPKTTYTIACIDDSPTVLKAIRSFLDDASFSIVMIDNPVKALMQIIRSKPDLVLLDVEMPNLDGYELCSLLRRHSFFKSTPIIMVTGNTGFIDRAKAKLAGASGYLTKPFTQPDLLKMVFKHLN